MIDTNSKTGGGKQEEEKKEKDGKKAEPVMEFINKCSCPPNRTCFKCIDRKTKGTFAESAAAASGVPAPSQKKKCNCVGPLQKCPICLGQEKE